MKQIKKSCLYDDKQPFSFIPPFAGNKTPTSRLREKRFSALAARISGRFAPSDEAKSASLPWARASCDSGRGASAFLQNIGGSFPSVGNEKTIDGSFTL
ncbi:hypothetical protein AB1283_16000 [Bacillus sp. S13(2024)]|uniref:hypothetical protein n=1 Tax=unclassified Bacillus (in: firmicutes) TaxID=185979 RepID=UPI003D1CD2C1